MSDKQNKAKDEAKGRRLYIRTFGCQMNERDSELIAGMLMEKGYQGDGHPPEIPEEVFFEVSRKYQQAYEVITGAEFRPQGTNPEAEKQKLLSFVEERQEEN